MPWTESKSFALSSVASPVTVSVTPAALFAAESVRLAAVSAASPVTARPARSRSSASVIAASPPTVPWTESKSFAADVKETESVLPRLSVSVVASIVSPVRFPPCVEVPVSTISPALITAVLAAAALAFWSSVPFIVIFVTLAPPMVPAVCVISPLIVIVPSPLSIMSHPFCSTLAFITLAFSTPSFSCVNVPGVPAVPAVMVSAEIWPPLWVMSLAFISPDIVTLPSMSVRSVTAPNLS